MTAAVPPRLDVVVIGVRDLAATREFYEALGWRSRPRDGLFARFELAGASLVLFPLAQLEDAVGVPAQKTGMFSGTAPAIVLGTSEELDAAVAKVRSAGGTVLAEPTDRPWGTRTAYIADPEGTVWELAIVLPRG